MEPVFRLSGDAVHLQENWDTRRIPRIGGADQLARLRVLASMQRMADLISHYKAQLFIQHDVEQFNKGKKAPEYYE